MDQEKSFKKETKIMNLLFFMRAVLVVVIPLLGGLSIIVCNNAREYEAQEWREAARPVFQSRGTVDITDRATPQDLKNYLDPCFAVVWQERGLMSNCTTESIQITNRRPH